MLVSTEWSAGNEKAMCIKIEHEYKYLIHKNRNLTKENNLTN